MKKHPYPTRITGIPNQKAEGFSLIEFLVASALSMIVLLAVSKGYFTARQLNEAADSRMNSQQDIRNAANMMVRDARMAGGFGCFNMAAYTETVDTNVGNTTVKAVYARTGVRTIRDDNAANAGSEAFRLVNNPDNLIPVRRIPATDFRPNGFTATSDALVFVYGAADFKTSDPLVVSSCEILLRPAKGVSTDSAKGGLGMVPGSEGEISVMRYAVHAYASGTVGGQTGLFRFQLNSDNEWGDPQLLVKDVTGVNYRYVYVNDCPEGPGNTEKFEYSGDLSRIPALIRVQLRGGAEDANQIYTIDAAVRGGNICANRNFTS